MSKYWDEEVYKDIKIMIERLIYILKYVIKNKIEKQDEIMVDLAIEIVQNIKVELND